MTHSEAVLAGVCAWTHSEAVLAGVCAWGDKLAHTHAHQGLTDVAGGVAGGAGGPLSVRWVSGGIGLHKVE